MRKLLATTAASAALLVGITAAGAQQGHMNRGAGPGNAAQQGARGGEMHGGGRGMTGSTGPAVQRGPATIGRAESRPMSTPQTGERVGRPGYGGQGQAMRGETRFRGEERTGRPREAAGEPRGEFRREPRQQRAGEFSGERRGGRGTVGYAPHRAVDLSSQQRTQIHERLLAAGGVRPLRSAGFALSVGARVPARIHLYPLPAEIFEIVPEYQGYDYILVGDEVVIVDPVTLEVVAVIPA
jgi:hypothetical protein